MVASSYKSGTTLTMNIVRRLICLGREVPPFESLWPDARFHGELSSLVARLEESKQRRYLKTHLALDGLPYYPQVKYVVACRDPRDVFMSFWNHYRSMSAEFLEHVNGLPGRVGPPMPLCPDDIHQVWSDWIGRGWFPWETEGYPWWGNMRHVQSWWNFRHLDNILFVHFADLLADLPGQIRRIATYLEIDLPQAELPGVMETLTLGAMRDEAAAEDPEFASWFYNKGTNGRWREVLSPEELSEYAHKAAQVLDPECRRWLEHGS